MAKLLSLSINVSKINKARLIQGKNGQYLDLTVSINNDVDNYGNNVSCWEGQKKEERDAKAERNFLGNGKVIWSDDSQVAKPAAQNYEEAPVSVNDGDLPF